jgi:hypothetical protein
MSLIAGSHSKSHLNIKKLNNNEDFIDFMLDSFREKQGGFNKNKEDKVALHLIQNQIKAKNQERAKDLHFKKRILKENFVMMKDKIKEENIQKKKIVQLKKEIFKQSITNFKSKKLESIKKLREDEVKKDVERLKRKEEELDFWKKELQRRELNYHINYKLQIQFM